MKIRIFLLVALTVGAFLFLMHVTTRAQPAPLPMAGPATYTITLPAADVDMIGAGLNELPAKISNPIMERLVAQVRAQQAEFAKANPPPPPVKP